MAKAKKKVRAKKVILPRKMSALIKIALKDIRKVEKLPEKYVVDMGTYYDPNDQLVCTTGSGIEVRNIPICSVCAAGSVMVGTLGTKSRVELSPEAFAGNSDQLHAIDQLRSGYVTGAARQLDLSDWETDNYAKYDTDVPTYDAFDSNPFHKAMEKLQAKLEKAGL